MDPNNDDEIVAGLKAGSEHCLSLLLQKYHGLLMGVAMTVYGLQHDNAKSVVNESFLRAWRKIATFNPKGPNSLRNWLYTILKHLIRDSVKKEKAEESHIKFVHFDELAPGGNDDLGELDGPAREVAQKLLSDFEGTDITPDVRIKIIYEVFAEFTEEEQELLWWHFWATPDKEIAKRLCVETRDVQALRTRINRLVHKFFKRIAELVGIDDWRKINDQWKRQNR